MSEDDNNIFKKASPDHPIYKSGFLVTTGIRPSETASEKPLTPEQIRENLEGGCDEAEDDDEKFVAMLLAHWLPTLAPTLDKPIAAVALSDEHIEALGEELLKVSTDYAGVVLYGLTLNNGYRIYLEKTYGDQFSGESPYIYPGSVVAGNQEILKRDTEWVQEAVKSGSIGELVDSCFMSEEWLDNQSAPEALGEYADIFDTVYGESLKRE